jgi:RHS repeat-associated protein
VLGKTPASTTVASGKVFPGQYFDSETGCHYNHFRYYCPDIGRYLTADPIGLNGGLNPYGYAEQNPIVNFDPLGLATWTVRGITSGSLVVGVGAKGLFVELESECQNGKKFIVNVTAVGPAAGLGFKCKTCFTAPANFSFGSVFTDQFPNADPSNLNGGFLSVGAGFQFQGFGGEYSQVVLGQAISPLSFSPAIGFGTFGADITGAIGTSTVTDVRTEDCGCE